MATINEQVKLSLRLVTTAFDDEIANDIAACFIDLARVGIVEIDDADPVIIRLAELYCKSALNFEQEGERYQNAYEFMRDGVSLAGDYNGTEA